MPEITVTLLRKRAEHNEGVIATLEEISLHQEELESINELLGSTCRKLKILYLQNNIISKMENLHHLKDLGYLNLALNNISKIEGLQNCEFLHKLDMTMNFVDVDALEESIKHLQSRERLRDMYMMGNPAQANWPNFTNYVIALLPQLENLDGTEITKSMRIVARQHLHEYEAELAALKKSKCEEKLAKLDAQLSAKAEEKGVYEAGADGFDLSEEPKVSDPDEMTENTPEARQEIYRELAQQKKEKEDAAAANQPRVRNHEKEQREKIEEIRRKEEESGEREVKQKNEGNWDFTWDEDSKPGCVLLEVAFPKHLDSSLIDVDVHPNYVSMVIKTKVLRLKIPVEVQSAESSCQRSKVTGSLTVTMPKVKPRETLAMVSKDKQKSKKADASNRSKKYNNSRSTTTADKPAKKLSMQEQMAAAAVAAGASVTRTERLEPTGGTAGVRTDFRNIVKKKPQEEDPAPLTVFQDMGFDNSGGKASLVELID